MNKLKIIALIMMVMLASAVIIHAQSGVALTSTDCLMPLPESEVIGETIRCGYISVLEDWQDPESRNIEVHYAVLASHSPTPEPDPVVYLHGGPGGVTLWAAALDALTFDMARANRDIILLDQRGSGFSTPMSCELFARSGEYDPAYLENLLGAPIGDNTERVDNLLCAQAYAENGLDWNGYNSYQSGRDVVELVDQLGYDAFNIHGGSYGTRLGLTIVREYPETVRSLTLDGTAQPWNTMTTIPGAQLYEQFTQVFSLCATGAACNNAYRDLESRWHALVDQLNVAPIDSDDFFEPLTGVRLLQMLVSDPLNRRFMPRIITELEAGDLATFRALEYRELNSPPPIPLVSDGFFELPYFEEGSDAEAVYLAILDKWEGNKTAADQAIALSAYGLLYRAEPGWSRDALMAWLESAYPEDSAMVSRAAALTDEELRLVRFNSAGLIRTSNNTYQIVNNCQEVAAIDSPEDVILYYEKMEIPEGLRLDEESVRQHSETARWNCAGFGLKPLPDRTFAPFETDVPILFLQGGSDTSTPPPWARQAHADMPGSYYVEFPELGHVTLFAPDDDCPKQVFQQFLDNPAAAPDTSCVTPLQFSLPDEPLPEPPVIE